MELWQLRYFVAVAESGSVARAAKRLCIAAPAVSRAIKALEDQLSARLFDRDGRGMHLTAAGSTLLRRAIALLRDTELARQEVASVSARHYGNISVGMTPSVMAAIGRPLVDRFRHDFPEIRLRLLESYSGYLIDWVRGGSIALAIVNGRQPDDVRLVAERLATERLFAVGPPGRFTDAYSDAALGNLLQQSLLLPSSQHSTRELVDAAAQTIGLPVIADIEVDSIGLFKELVSEGKMLGILPHGAISQDIGLSRLSAAPIVEPEIRCETWVIHVADAPLSQAAAAVLEEIRTLFAQLLEQDADGIYLS